MQRRLTALMFCLGLGFATGCDAGEEGDDSVTDDAVGKADASFPSLDFPNADTHCEWAFNGDCDQDARFGPGRWASLGARVDTRADVGDEIEVRAFVESDDLSDLRARLYYSPEPVSSLSEAERIGVVSIEGTRTGFGGNGMEVQATTVVEDFMLEGRDLEASFYIAFSGTDGTIRAIDLDM